MKIRKGIVKRLHVSQPLIRQNLKDGGSRPVLSVVTSKGTFHATTVDIRGSSRLVYSPKKPISCGARVWIETRAELEFEE